MNRWVIRFLVLAAVFGLAAGCSRTYDGSIVPTYGLATDKVAGIPYLTLKHTPLDEPDMRGLAVPPPEGVSEARFDTAGASGEPAARAAPSRLRASRRAPHTGRPGDAKALKCRDAEPGPRLVQILCQ